MSQITGCICYECNKWHSHIVPLFKDGAKRNICINCNQKLKKEVRKKND